MTPRCVRAATLVCLALVAAATAPQAQTAGGTIAGVVVSTDAQPQPVRRAIVMLTGAAMPSNLSVVTDDGGRFRFVNVAAGRYTVAVSKPAYLPLAYGATRPGRPGTSIALAAGQNVDLRVALPRGAVIAGAVRDQFGQLIRGIQVTVSRVDDVNVAAGRDQFGQPLGGIQVAASGPEPVNISSGRSSAGLMLLTDDRGAYRAFGLIPGEYVVSAAQNVARRYTRNPSEAEVDAQLRALGLRHSVAPAPSPMATVSSAAAREAPSASADARPGLVGFAPMFYPGTAIAANAARIRVAAGEERSAIDIPFVPVPTALVSGVIQGSDVSPERLVPTLTMAGSPQPSIVSPPLTGPLADGSFTFSGVTPGQYVLMARAGRGALMRDGNRATSTNPDVVPRFAAIDLTVDGRDVRGLVLALRPALSLAGRVVFDASTLKPPEALTSLRVSLLTLGPGVTGSSGGRGGTGAPPAAAVAADGSFLLTGILPGTYALSVAVPAPGAGGRWWLRSAMAGGRDLLDDLFAFEMGSADLAGVVLTVTDRHSGIVGTLTTATGQPASEFVVIAFPSDRAYWRVSSRRIKVARPASDGAFTFDDLPAGEYFVAALTDFEMSDLAQSSFLDQIVPTGVKVTIVEGQKTRQDLRIAR